MKAIGKGFELPADRLVKLTKNQRVAILGGTLLLMVAMYVVLFFMPQRQATGQLTEQVRVSSEELAKVKATVATLGSFKAEMARTQMEFERALSLLPDKKEIPGLLSSISQAGGQCGLEFIEFKPQLEIPKLFYAEIPVRLKVLGNYHDIARFFDAVSKLPRIVNISEVKMSDPKETSTGQMVVTAECLATTYKFIENPTDAIKDQPNKKNQPPAPKRS